MNKLSRSSTAREDRTHLATVMTAFEPIEDYRLSHLAGRSTSISPLDFYLVHLLFDFLPQSTLVDLASVAAEGEPAVATLLHDRTRQVYLVAAPAELKERICSFVQNCDSPTPALEKLRLVGSVDEIAAQSPRQLLVWIHFDAGEPETLVSLVSQVEMHCPDAVILCTGLGRVGNCPGIKSLLNENSDRSFRLARELVEVFGQSTLGVLCRATHRPFEQALTRIQALHNGNLDYLRLLRATHFQAMEAARAHDMAEDEARSFPELNQKILERSRKELEAEIESLRLKLAVPAPVVGPTPAVDPIPTVDPIVNSQAYRLAVRLQRLRNKVAPHQSLRFRIYRASLKVAKLAVWSPLRWLRRKTRQSLRLR